MLEGCKNFITKKYKKAKYSVLLRPFRTYLHQYDFDKILYSVEIKKIEHTHLTKYVRKHGVVDVQDIANKCDVDLHLGALPPELLNLVEKEEVAKKTKEFFSALDKLIAKYGSNLSDREHQTYDISEIGDIFKTHCVIHTYKPLDKTEIIHESWGGSFGDVYKLSFPEIGVEYALKVYKNLEKDYKQHGVFYEIPIAFYANKINPKDNNKIYMGRLHKTGYMISKWQEKQEGHIRQRRFPVLETSYNESDARKCNFINGLRIDFGETYKTSYAQLSNNARKWYRKMQVVDLDTIKSDYAKLKTNFDKNDFYAAMNLFFLEYVQCNRLRLTNTQQEEITDLLNRKKVEIFDKYFKQIFEMQY